MILRVRSNVGVWRVEVSEQDCTVHGILQGISATRPHVVYEQPLSRDPACQQPLPTGVRLDFLQHGSMVYCRVDPTTCADQSIPADRDDADAGNEVSKKKGKDNNENTANDNKPATNMRRVIGKDGSIVLVPSNEMPAEKEKGFRKGMMALRDMKMHWTRTYYIHLLLLIWDCLAFFLIYFY